jgi:serine/threonine protein kinase
VKSYDMNNVILAAFLGRWEILVILAMLLFLAASAGALAWLIVYLVRREKSLSPPPPPAPATEVIPRRCPQCGKALQPDVPEGLCPVCLLQRGLGTEGGGPPGTPPFMPPSLAELAKLFPQLEILELIGQGGMGAVYKARQPALDRLVALKILAPRSSQDLGFAERFTREARALAKLSHPNIVGVYDFGRAELPLGQDAQQRVPTTPIHYFIMEFVDGPNLRQVERAGKLSPREALEIIPQICAALQFAHDEGVVHRDIKPENVLLDKKGRVKIADFGLAKILGQEPKDLRLTGARDVMGTPHYMAPEQVEKPQAVDHRADIYSLGVVFYEMLTGELPLGKFQPPSAKVQIDVRLDEVVLHALAKEPERRYQQASQVRTAVETIANSPGTAAANVGGILSPSSGRDYRTPQRFLGLPLIHVAWGIDPATHRPRVAKGWLAVGPKAMGLLATGLEAYGLFAVGLIAGGIFPTGLAAFGVWSVGLVAYGLLATGLLAVAWFQAVGLTALGNHSVGLASCGISFPVFMLLGLPIVAVWVLRLVRSAVRNTSRDAGLFPHRHGRSFAIALAWVVSILIFASCAFIVTVRLIQTRNVAFYRQQQGEPDRVEFRSRVFEADAALVDRLIPMKQRQSGVSTTNRLAIAPYERQWTQGTNSYTTSFAIQTDSRMAEIGPDTLTALLNGIAVPPGLLSDRRRIISSWPREADVWCFIPTTENHRDQWRQGGGTGFLGVHRLDGRRQIRIEYQVTSVFAFGAVGKPPEVHSDILYEGSVPSAGILAFLFPFHLKDGAQRYLVMAIEIAPDRHGILATNQLPAAAEIPASPLAFGPVIERTINFAMARTNYLICFRTGDLRTPPLEMEGSTQDIYRWSGREGVDAGVGIINSNVFCGFDLAVLPAPRECWEELTPVQAARRLDSRTLERYAIMLYGYETLPYTCVLKTRRNEIGVLQVTGYVSDPPGWKVRYKLLDNAPEVPPLPATTGSWSPQLWPGEKPDPQQILNEANTLMSQGHYEESLQRHLWHFNHALEYNPSLSGVRLTSALSDWVELGRRYPKAKQVLVEIRDEKTREIVEGRGYSEMVKDVQAINEELQNDEATYALFQIMRQRDPKLADQSYFWLEDLLVAKGEYQWCLSHLGDPQSHFAESIRRSYEMELDSQKRMAELNRQYGRTNSWSPSDHSEAMKKSAENRFVGRTRQLIEILVGANRKADAEKIRDQAVAVLDDPRLKSAVSDAEEKIQKRSVSAGNK